VEADMIRLQLTPLASLKDAQAQLQTAIGVEFGTLPPYLYALYSIKPGTNAEAAARIKSVVLQEMIHMCLACNILNALGGDPLLKPQRYPGPLPGDIGPNGTPLTLHLYPFSSQAMEQAMAIEQPEKVPDFPIARAVADLAAAPKAVTIGEFYRALDAFLATLPKNDWKAGRNQIVDDQFFAGQVFAVNGYPDAHQAIEDIVSEGEGAKDDPLDFQHDIAHFYRFGEIYHEKVLTKANNPLGYAWGPAKFPVDWSGAYPAIIDPATHDFSQEPAAAQAAQKACDAAYATLVDALQAAVTGQQGAMGKAVRAMFDLRMAARHAFTVPLADAARVAGPAFRTKQS
jgi:ferritin-like protein